MSNTIAKTFRISPFLSEQIEKGAKKYKIPQGYYLELIFLENCELKMKQKFKEDLMKMRNDKEYRKQEQGLAEANFF